MTNFISHISTLGFVVFLNLHNAFGSVDWTNQTGKAHWSAAVVADGNLRIPIPAADYMQHICEKIWLFNVCVRTTAPNFSASVESNGIFEEREFVNVVGKEVCWNINPEYFIKVDETTNGCKACADLILVIKNLGEDVADFNVAFEGTSIKIQKIPEEVTLQPFRTLYVLEPVLCKGRHCKVKIDNQSYSLKSVVNKTGVRRIDDESDASNDRIIAYIAELPANREADPITALFHTENHRRYFMKKMNYDDARKFFLDILHFIKKNAVHPIKRLGIYNRKV